MKDIDLRRVFRTLPYHALEQILDDIPIEHAQAIRGEFDDELVQLLCFNRIYKDVVVMTGDERGEVTTPECLRLGYDAFRELLNTLEPLPVAYKVGSLSLTFRATSLHLLDQLNCGAKPKGRGEIQINDSRRGENPDRLRHDLLNGGTTQNNSQGLQNDGGISQNRSISKHLLETRIKNLRLTLSHFPDVPHIAALINFHNLTTFSLTAERSRQTPRSVFKWRFPERLTTVSIEGYNFSLKDAVFPSGLQLLNLQNNGIDSLEGVRFPSSLRSLNLAQNKLTDLNVTFPPTLIDLNLKNNNLTAGVYRDHVVRSSLWQFPPHLERLDLSNNPLGDIAGASVHFPETLISLRLQSAWIERIHSFQVPAALEELSLAENGISDLSGIIFNDRLKKINLNSNSLGDIACVFPDSVEELRMERNQIVLSSEFKAPKSLRILSLRMCLAFGDSFHKLRLPDGVRSLQLSYTGIKNIRLTVFPSELEVLDLSGSYLQDLSHVDLSHLGGLTTLNLENASITTVEHMRLPDSLTTLVMLKNLIHNWTGFALPQQLRSLNLMRTGLKEETLLRFHNFARHPHLQRLTLSSNIIETFPPSFEFPPNLTFLNLERNSITSLSSISFPATLEVLLCDDNSMKSLEGVVLPENILRVSFLRNEIRSIDNFQLPELLRSLSLDDNLLTSIDRVQFPARLERLSLGNNKISRVNDERLPRNLTYFNILGGNVIENHWY
ncbi:hypothetical protein BABINDRAFT_162460 [Babjeviella inositovora NRRL Y-12698]|uniref:Uncharacterized protein n=1 Tax=Babjeviella inositovora NRRL Y-12698 TaxID=984486 RepID=A0A1E3QP70_9ASCO|nr:uncharacterized protein BABINDRAFT_162460 [Babjeviella inositovora NRRL Y-12698]ODQ78777.1 hypothetical protein BABINDRAFT_162460 [Babjeviella inositovora NRRL Y-12698]